MCPKICCKWVSFVIIWIQFTLNFYNTIRPVLQWVAFLLRKGNVAGSNSTVGRIVLSVISLASHPRRLTKSI